MSEYNFTTVFSKYRTVTADQWDVGRVFIGTEPDMIID